MHQELDHLQEDASLDLGIVHASSQAMTPGDYTDESARWDAVLHRRSAADGHFFYAVKTTGVFCRPSCSSRRPLRRNVELFDWSGQAMAAGYRPCLKCRPTSADAPERGQSSALVRACRLLAEEDRPARSADVARQVGLSAHYFQRFFKKHTGVTPQEFRRRALSERAKDELPKASSVTEAIYSAGYSSSSRFYDSAAHELGMAPKEARTGARGRSVHYAVRRCSLGRVLIAWTERGVCDVRFGDSGDALATALCARFPKAALEKVDVPTWVDLVLEAVEAPRTVDIPLDISGTAFQQRVWRELRRIPLGATRTYAAVATAVGAPSAARAVARACATNSIAVVIPCHRVVRSDGDHSGYRWGMSRKRKLLDRESRSRG